MRFKEFINLMEQVPPNKTKIAVFDFDDTLVQTTNREQGIPDYEARTGKPWVINTSTDAEKHGFPKNFRRTGWWGRPETLHPPIFDPTPDKLNADVARMFHGFKNDPQTYVVVMTGRHSKLEDRVKEILNKYGIHADDYIFKGQKNLTQHPNYPKNNETIDYKIFVIIEKLMNHNIESLEIFEDRPDHVAQFMELGKNLKKMFPNLKSVVVHDVVQGKNYPI